MSLFPATRRPAFRLLLGLALTAHLAAAWFNVGYLHPDEHYQVLEFAHYRLGHTEGADLPWEYEARIRPALQPLVAMIAMRGLSAVGVESPFHVSLVLRLLSALLGLIVALGIWRLSARWLVDQGWHRVALVLTLLFWAMPMLHARFSSENWSGIFLFAGLILLLAEGRDDAPANPWAVFGSGLLMGCSFFFRFQMGLALAGLVLWLVWIHRPGARSLVRWGLGLGIALGLGVLADRWFYGQWVWTPLNYLYVNLVEGRAAEFGTEPWWWYLVMLLLQLVPPLSLVWVASGLTAIVTRWRNVLVWVLVPFLLVHSIIGHKELRFLYPMIYLLPVIGVLALDGAGSAWAHRLRRWRASHAVRAVVYGCIVLNVLVMAVGCLLPANHSAVIQQWLYDTSRDGQITVYTLDRNPYVGARHRMNFYATDRVEVRVLTGERELDSLVQAASDPIYLFHDRSELPEVIQNGRVVAETRCRSLPNWVEQLPLVRGTFTLRIWGVYACRPGVIARAPATAGQFVVVRHSQAPLFAAWPDPFGGHSASRRHGHDPAASSPAVVLRRSTP